MYKTVLISFLTAVICARAADWPQFCGPERNNLSAETGLAREWSAEGPEVLWTVNVTTGYAGPAVLKDKVYLMGHEENKSSVRCYDLNSGKELWDIEFDDPGTMKNKKYPGTRGTPTVTDDSVYAVTLYGTAFCADLKTKKIKWSHNLNADFGKVSDAFGFAQSPLLVDDLVVLAPLTESHGVIALNRKSGEIVWNAASRAGPGFMSPSLITVGGEKQIVIAAGGKEPKKSRRRRPRNEAGSETKPAENDGPPKAAVPSILFAVSPKDGKELWHYDNWFCRNPIPHPVTVKKNTIFLTSGYKSISTLLQVEKKGSAYDVQEVWKTEAAATQIEQPIFMNDHLFVGGTVKRAKKGLICIDLDGEVKWDSNQIDGAPAFDHINMIGTDGMLIGLDGKSGKLHLIEATPDGFNELASAKVVAEKGQTWAPIALSDGKLLVRDHNEMKCLNLRK